MKKLLFILTICVYADRSESISNVVWQKNENKFVPISDVPQFRAYQLELLAKVRAKKTYTFHGEPIRLMYYQEENIFEFYDNDTKVTGICGDIWTTLSESLNFTIIPVRQQERNIGYMLPDNTFSHILGNISRYEVDMIPKTEMYCETLAALKYLEPFWETRFYLYANWKPRHDQFWIVKVFSWKVWCAIGAMHVLLTVCGYLTQTYSIDEEKMSATIGEHCFINFATLCNQNYIPENFRGRSKIFQLTMGFYYLLIYTSFSALLYNRLTYRVPDPPFKNIRTLLDNTDYHIAVIEHSTAHAMFLNHYSPDFDEVVRRNRLTVVESIFEVFRLVCESSRSKLKHAMILNEITKKAFGTGRCQPDQFGEPLLRTWISVGVRKNFQNVETINTQLLKMREVGLIEIFEQRWIDWKNLKKSSSNFNRAIGMSQIYIPLSFYAAGVALSILILLLENCVYCFERRHDRG